jgi:hypothetical protein
VGTVNRFLTKTKLNITHGFVTLVLVVLLSVGCSGQNFSKPAENQVFGQKVTYNNQVDVLWVIDPTSQMSTKQQALANQIGLVVDAFNQTGLDYQMAVTTMDMSLARQSS